MEFAVGLVHAEEVAGEKGCFVAADTGADFEKAWEGCEGVGGDEGSFEGIGKGFEV